MKKEVTNRNVIVATLLTSEQLKKRSLWQVKQRSPSVSLDGPNCIKHNAKARSETTVRQKLGWIDISTSSIAEFANRNNLDAATLSSAEPVLILPSNATFNELPQEHLFASSAKEVLFVLRESNVAATIYQDNRERRELILKSDLVILPTLYYVAGAASSVALSVLANWIYDRFVKNNDSEDQPSIRYESADRMADGSVRWRRVEGPANEVCKLLRQESKALTDGMTHNSQRVQRQGGPQWHTNQKKALQKVSRKGKK